MTITRYARVLALLLLGYSTAWCETSPELKPTFRRNLAGLKSTQVTLSVDPELESAGLSAASLLSETESRLRMAGITVHSPSPGQPMSRLKVDVGMVPITVAKKELGYGVRVQAQLLETAWLSRSPGRRCVGMTWADESLLVTNNPTGDVRANLKDLVDGFVHDYLAANPARR